MSTDFPNLLYVLAMNQFARPVTFTPVKSQPGQPSYPARAITNTDGASDPADAGTIIADQITILDILEQEFPILPAQGDTVFIPKDPTDSGPAATYEITSRYTNGAGQTTLNVKKLVTAAP